jgi:hypothetical protein
MVKRETVGIQAGRVGVGQEEAKETAISRQWSAVRGVRGNTGAVAGTPWSPIISPHIMSRTRNIPNGSTSSPMCATNFRWGKEAKLEEAEQCEAMTP